ncbi:MAG: GIY-YIG nuclease family protein [Bacteroidetes bacterium]|nr:GIY-YIG nuclease family protein [Bacteroidota bacterium]MDA1120346.1 GIY-YIG nuclease family protein [Bacteroidota bacterium]
MSYFVYLLQSQKDQTFYIGQSNDPISRLAKHNAAQTGYTSRKQPWEIVYLEEFRSRAEAIKRERFFKKQKNTNFYLKLIHNWPG